MEHTVHIGLQSMMSARSESVMIQLSPIQPSLGYERWIIFTPNPDYCRSKSQHIQHVRSQMWRLCSSFKKYQNVHICIHCDLICHLVG